jgi:hypothetical protein
MRLRLAGHHDGSHRGRRFALAALLALVCLAILAPRAHGAKGMEIATQDDPRFVSGEPVGGHSGPDPSLGIAREIRVSRIRIGIGWADSLAGGQRNSASVPGPIQYDFSRWDNAVARAKLWGIKVQLDLQGTAPRWATADHKEGGNKPNPKLFAQFASAAVAHFKGKVDRYSVWNEPNYTSWLNPIEQSGTLYRKLYSSGYKAIKKADPTAQVLIAETAPREAFNRRSKTYNSIGPLAFLRQLTCSNKSFTKTTCKGGLKADGYAHHPYDYSHKPTYKDKGKNNVTLGTLSKLTTALDRVAKTGALMTPKKKPLDLYLTEYGYLRQGAKATPEATRAKYTVQAFKIAQKNKRVKQMLNYLLVEPSTSLFFDTSLVLKDGTRTPTFNALAAWASSAASKKQIQSPGAVDPAATSGSGSDSGGGNNGGGTGAPGSGGNGSPVTGTPAEPLCTVFPNLCAVQPPT